jgi:hypothetical protein
MAADAEVASARRGRLNDGSVTDRPHTTPPSLITSPVRRFASIFDSQDRCSSAIASMRWSEVKVREANECSAAARVSSGADVVDEFVE